MNRLILILCSLCLPLVVSAQEISDYLYNAVPKEYRPKNQHQVTLPELGSLMKNAKWRIIDNDKAIRELDTLCIRYAPSYGSISAKNDRAEYLYIVSTYWVGRVETFLDSMLKYSLLFDIETKDGINGIEKIAGAVALREAIVYSDHTREYKKAYNSATKAIDIFRQIKDSIEIAKSCLQLTDLYSNLGLYKKASDYLDSANRYETKSANANYVDFKFNYAAELFLKQYAETKEPRFADSLNKLIIVCNDTVTYPESAYKFFQNGLYLVKARLHYYQQDYERSLQDLDSAIMAIEGVTMASYDAVNIQVFKGLNLLQLGKAKEGIAILESVQPAMSEFHTGMMLEEIYNYEKKNGNLEKALTYHEKMMEYNANEQLLKHQGQLLEMEQQYNVAARDLQIIRLKAQQDKVKYIIAFIALLFLSITGFTVIRLRNNRRKTQRLLSQIEELTQMQIIRLVEAEKKAQEMERKRIGQELHDDLASSLAGVLQYMRTKTSRENDPAEKTEMRKAVDILENSYAKTRSKSHDIYFRESEGQFTSMLADNVNLFFSGTGIKVNAEIDDAGMEELSANVKTNILLIIKEALANVIKHAKASNVNLLLYSSNNKIHIEVGDDGMGFSNWFTNGKSLGLNSIKNRIEKINGDFNLESKIKGGTLLRVILPVK